MKTCMGKVAGAFKKNQVGFVSLLVIGLVIGLLAASSGFSSFVSAAPPKMENQKVYGLTLFDGLTYQSTFAPKTEDTIYMMADVDNIVSPLITKVYYWPITREYMASWFDYKKEPKGDIEIWQKARRIKTLPSMKYIFSYPKGAYSDEMVLFVGAEAQRKFDEYKKNTDKYYEEAFEYYKKQEEYEKAVGDYLKNPKKFKTPPAAPEEPKPPSGYVAELSDAHIVNLPEGVYEIRFVERPAPAEPVTESEKEEGKDQKAEAPPAGSYTKRLVVFKARRHGIGYEMIPEEKWTYPSKTDEPREAMYMEGKRVLFLKAFDEGEYNEKYYINLSKLHAPFEGRGRENNWMWAHHKEQTGLTLQILKGGKVVATVDRKPYRVEQTPGYALGYKIVEYDPKKDDPSRQPAFEAYRLELDASSDMQIRMIDKNGKVIPGSTRDVRAINVKAAKAFYLSPLVPVLVGLAVLFLRRGLSRGIGGGPAVRA